MYGVNTARRSAPYLLFVLPSAAWTALNMWAYGASMRHARDVDAAVHAWAVQTAIDNGRDPAEIVPLPAETWAVDWAGRLDAVWPAVLMLAGGALLAVALRRARRGPWFLLAAVAPVLAAPLSSSVGVWRDNAAGLAVASYTGAWPSFAAQGVELPPTTGPAWVLWLAVVLAFAAILAPVAAVGPARGTARLTARAALLRGGTLALALYPVVLALSTIDVVADISYDGVHAAAWAALCLPLAVALAGRDDVRRTGALLVGALTALGAASGPFDATVGLTALLVALVLTGLALVPIAPWARWRDRLNGRHTVVVVEGPPATVADA